MTAVVDLTNVMNDYTYNFEIYNLIRYNVGITQNSSIAIIPSVIPSAGTLEDYFNTQPPTRMLKAYSYNQGCTIAWKPMPDIFGYIIWYKKDKLYLYTVVNNNVTAANINGLINNNSYSFAVSPFGINGVGPLSNIVTVTPGQNVLLPYLPKGTQVLTAQGYKVVESLNPCSDLLVDPNGVQLTFRLIYLPVYSTNESNAPYTIPVNNFSPGVPNKNITIFPKTGLNIRDPGWFNPIIYQIYNQNIVQAPSGQAVEYYQVVPDMNYDYIIEDGNTVQNFILQNI